MVLLTQAPDPEMAQSRIDPVTTIAIPGEPGLVRTFNIPAESVALPIEARAKIGWAAWLLLFPSTLLFVLGAFSLAAAALGGAIGPALVIVALFMTAIAICAAGASLTLIKDRFSRQSSLFLDAAGITDHRSFDRAIPWKDISHARIRYTRAGFGAVTLQLRHPVAARHNPFRLGTLGFLWRRRPVELHVPLLSLTVGDRRLALTVATLVKLHGGEIDAFHPYNGVDPLKHH